MDRAVAKSVNEAVIGVLPIEGHKVDVMGARQ
jgi:hypothetical protein